MRTHTLLALTGAVACLSSGVLTGCATSTDTRFSANNTDVDLRQPAELKPRSLTVHRDTDFEALATRPQLSDMMIVGWTRFVSHAPVDQAIPDSKIVENVPAEGAEFARWSWRPIDPGPTNDRHSNEYLVVYYRPQTLTSPQIAFSNTTGAPRQIVRAINPMADTLDVSDEPTAVASEPVEQD